MTQDLDCSEARIALGVYVLGTIDPAEQALVDAHLDSCDACLAEMAELAALMPLLALVPAEEAEQAMSAEEAAGTGGTVLTGPWEATGPTEARAPQRAPASEDRRGSGEPRGPEAKREGLAGAAGRANRTPRRRGVRGVGVYPPGRWLAVAAAVAVIGAASFGGVKLAASPAGSSAGIAAPDPHNAFGAPIGAWQTGYVSAGEVTATVAYRPMGWGTQLAAKIAGLPLNTPCQLWVVEGNGTRIQAGGWDTDANEGTVWYPASAPVPATVIKSIVITITGRQPVTISAT